MRFVNPSVLPGLLILVIGLVLNSCGNSENTNPASGRSKTMILHLPNDPQGMNPVNSIGADAAYLHSLVFDHLIALDFETLQLVPQVAETMPEISEDRTRMTFHMRKDVKFTDGKVMTAKDVEFSFKAIMNPYVDSAPRRVELQNLSNCVAEDDHTVTFSLTNAGPFDLNKMAINFFVLPQHIYDPEGLTDAYTAAEARMAERRPDSVTPDLELRLLAFADFFDDEKFQREKGFVVGSGKFNFDGWQAGQYIRLVRNRNYWNKDIAVGMDTVIFKTIPDIQTAFQSLKSGEIDFGDDFTPEQFKDQMNGEDFGKHFEKKALPFPFYEYVGWNTKVSGSGRKSIFADAKVRRAMAHLINVDEIISNVMMETAEPIQSLVYKDRPEYNTNLVAYEFNPERATSLLEEAGWKDSNGDGILDNEMEGELVDFEFALYYRRGNEMRERIARHIKAKMEKVGIKVETKDLDWKVMLERLKKHTLDAWIGGWVYDSDEQDLYSLFHSSQILNSGYNWTSYNNPRADSVMEAIVHEWDQDKRYQLHKEIQQILHQDQPYTYLFANSARIAYNKRLANDKWYGQRPCYQVWEFQLAKSPN